MRYLTLMRRFLVLPIAWFHVLASTNAATSALWGTRGESWDPAGRLPDVSFAGYAGGETAPPRPPVTANVRDFGAKGDGKTDDSAAFLAAIDGTERGVILIPPGRYVITRILEIRKPDLVLRGAGPESTALVFPAPLNDIKPNWGETTGGLRTSNYSWSGGFVWFKGSDKGAAVGKVTAPAKRGDREIRVSGNSAALSPGTWIEIRVGDDEKRTLLSHLYDGDPGNLSKIKPSSHKTTFVTRVRAEREGRVTIERPLRIDLRPGWNPEVRLYQPDVVRSGVEDIGFEFPARAYGGHFSELGFNAVAFNGVAHCWARNLMLTNADSGVFAGGRFCTIDGIVCLTRDTKEHGGTFGHHGVSLTGHDNLLTRFDFRQRFIHDLTVSGGAGNVFSSGRAEDLAMDHHKRAPYDNVFTDIDAGKGTRLWKCGGGANLGRHCGARGTFWNIRAERGQRHPGDFGPASMNLVSVQPAGESVTDPEGRWFESTDPRKIEPGNIHAAQLEKRLGRPWGAPLPRR